MGMLMRRPGRWERSTPVDKNRLEEGYTVIKPNMKDEKRIFFYDAGLWNYSTDGFWEWATGLPAVTTAVTSEET